MASETVLVAPETTTDPRLASFCSQGGPEVFHALAHLHEVGKPDPLDVDTIHADARTTFERLVNRATTPPGVDSGRVLLLLGESGSGKTHLMRAFRNHVHGRQAGFCGYLQMTTATDNYGRYVLGNLIDWLDKPYDESRGDTTGLMRLANALAETPHAILPAELARLRGSDLDAQELARLINELADLILTEGPFSHLDLDLIRALLYLQRNDPRIRGRILKYLRGEDLSDADRQVLGGLVPRKHAEDPQRLVERLGQAMAAVPSAALVLLIDQLEDIHVLDGAAERFRRAMTAVRDLTDRVPSSVVVVACLEDFYTDLKTHLSKAVLDRLERDPEPIRLTSHRTEDEIRELVKRRLMHLYDSLDVPFEESQPTYPIPEVELQKLTNLTTRDVLDWCRRYREQCVQAGQPASEFAAPDDKAERKKEEANPSDALLRLQQAWNDWHNEWAQAPPLEEKDLAALLSEAIKACAAELETGHWFEAEAHGRMIPVERHDAANTVALLQLGICNKRAQGGSLGKQVDEVVKLAGENPVVILRSTEFPNSPKTAVSQKIAKVITRGGRRVQVTDADWRTMLAAEAFRQQHASDPAFPDWLREDRPLTRLGSLRSILDLDHLKRLSPDPPPAEPPAPSPLPPVTLSPPALEDTGPLVVGVQPGRVATPVTLDPAELKQHAAFLGGSGSGKTTVALHLVEQLLLRGIPAILLDRKGDLCGYARLEFWSRPLEDANQAARRDRLRSRVDVAVFTPGNPRGRPLAIRLVPNGLNQLAGWEREQVAGYAAYALGSMMGYNDRRQQDASRLAILTQAIALLSTPEFGGSVTLDELLAFIGEPDPSLVTAIGHLDTKLCKLLVQHLETLRLNKRTLLSAEGDRLDADLLLGLGRHAVPGKTRLSIVSTKFLGDNANVEFWVAQLLFELTRWSSKNARDDLQAVLLMDEADLYLPAQRKPATKEPMENLLKRARSAGLGLLLASQSPGDFDYKCRDNIRTWFLGRIKEPTALAKMKPMLSDCRLDVAARLPTQQTGQFHLVRDGDVTGLRTDRSLLATEQLVEEKILDLARGR